MINTTKGIIFGKLILMFKLVVPGTEAVHSLALIQPFDTPIGQALQMEQDLGLMWVHGQPRSQSEFFFVSSIIHGCYIVEKFDSYKNDFYVVDYIDTDMFYRLKELHSL